MSSTYTNDTVQMTLFLIGDSKVGKTSLLLRQTNGAFSSELCETVGIDFRVKSIPMNAGKEEEEENSDNDNLSMNKNKIETKLKRRKNEVGIDMNIRLILWDTAGQERFHGITMSYLNKSESDGILFVYDITNRESFESIRDEWICHTLESSNPNCHMILIGNKSDQMDQRVVSTEEGQQLANEFDMMFFETSAKDNVNVEESFDSMVQKILDGLRMIDVNLKDENEDDCEQRSKQFGWKKDSNATTTSNGMCCFDFLKQMMCCSRGGLETSDNDTTMDDHEDD